MNGSTTSATAPPDPWGSVLRATLTTIPYNSATEILEYFADRHVPEHFGMSCAFQTEWAARAVERQGGGAATLRLDGRHITAAYDIDDTLVLLDPYLLHQVPLRLCLADEQDGVIRTIVDAYPVRHRPNGEPVPSRLRAVWNRRAGWIRLDYMRYSTQRDHKVMARTFLLRDGDVLAQFPSPRDAVRGGLLHEDQSNLSVRILTADTERMAEVVLPLLGVGPATPVTAAALVSRDNDGRVSRHGTASFDRDLDVVADAISATPADVIALLLDATATYARFAPPGRDLAPYPVEDE